jgi:hypothetical protein
MKNDAFEKLLEVEKDIKDNIIFYYPYIKDTPYFNFILELLKRIQELKELIKENKD